MELDLTKVLSRNANKTTFNSVDLEYNGEMKSHRDANGIVSGYLIKTAQSLSKFQRKYFYRRYYELDMQKK